jgi:hypothetical protein
MTEDHQQIIAPGLPLRDFFEELSAADIIVTSKQIEDIEDVLAYFSLLVGNEMELCQYLSSIICQNRDDQLLFEHIYKRHFSDGISPSDHLLSPTDGEKKNSDNRKIKKGIWLAAVLLAVIGIYYFTIQPPSTDLFRLIDVDGDAKLAVGRQPFTVAAGELLRLNGVIVGKEENPIKTIIDWGDKTRTDTNKKSHIFSKAGIYLILVQFQTNKRDSVIKVPCRVSRFRSSLIIKSTANSNKAYTGENINMTAQILANVQPQSILWEMNGSTVASKKSFDTAFAIQGQQSVVVKARYSGIDTLANLCDTVFLNIYKNVPTATIVTSPDAKTLSSKGDAKPIYYYLLGIPLALALLIEIWGWPALKKMRAQKVAESEAKRFNEFVESISGEDQPASLSFASRDYLIVTESLLKDCSRQMRQRIQSEQFILNIRKTIEKSTKALGHFQPVEQRKNRQKDFLILVNQSEETGQQVHILNYLTDQLGKQQVSIDLFYYNSEPSTLYNKNYPEGLSLKKISEKFQNSILLMLGDISTIYYVDIPVIKRQYADLLKNWEKKIIVTTMPFPDWGHKEMAAIASHIPVLPIDLPGFALLMKMVFEDPDDAFQSLKKQNRQFYSVDIVDFSTIEQLIAYCESLPWAGKGLNNTLFQAIAALAVYPSLNWELLVVFISRILEAQQFANKLNFSTLLSLSRISWIKNGTIPENIRLELLKALEWDNEILIRETIVEILSSIPESLIRPSQIAYEEKTVQLMTNRFILYGFDRIKYKAYKGAAELFSKSWTQHLLSDSATKSYLRNKDRKWVSLIQPYSGGMPVRYDFPANSKQNTDLGLNLNKTEKLLAYHSFFHLILYFAAIIFLAFLHTVPSSRFAYLRSEASGSQAIKFIVIDRDRSKMKDSIEMHIDKQGPVTLKIGLKRTVALNSNHQLHPILIQMNSDVLLDSAMRFDEDSYDISLYQPSLFISTLVDSSAGEGSRAKIQLYVSNKKENRLAGVTVTASVDNPATFIGKDIGRITGTTNKHGELSFSVRYPTSSKATTYNVKISATLGGMRASAKVELHGKGKIDTAAWGISKSDFKYSVSDFVSNEKAVFLDPAWKLWVSRKWKQLELLFTKNNLNGGWPPARGAIELRIISLRPGTLLVRYGGYTDAAGIFQDKGTFVNPTGVSFSQMALPDNTLLKPFKRYRVSKQINSVRAGRAIPWFGKPGLGLQYELPYTVNDLIQQGFLIEEKDSKEPLKENIRTFK